MERTIRKTAINLSKEALFILVTVASAVILPQILHGAGLALGVGGQLGQMFLPMYLPVMILGFYRGAVPGAIVGFLAPLVSFAITGMPAEALLPYITLELVATGVFAGIFANVKLFAPIRVLSVQLIAKVMRLAFLAVSLYFTTGGVSLQKLSAGIVTSIPGLVLQLLVVGFLVAYKDKKKNN